MWQAAGGPRLRAAGKARQAGGRAWNSRWQVGERSAAAGAPPEVHLPRCIGHAPARTLQQRVKLVQDYHQHAAAGAAPAPAAAALAARRPAPALGRSGTGTTACGRQRCQDQLAQRLQCVASACCGCGSRRLGALCGGTHHWVQTRLSGGGGVRRRASSGVAGQDPLSDLPRGRGRGTGRGLNLDQS